MTDDKKLKDENLEKVTGGKPPAFFLSNIPNPDKVFGVNAIYGAGADNTSDNAINDTAIHTVDLNPDPFYRDESRTR